MTETGIALLTDRGIVELEGPDALEFLQGLVTNDVEQARPEGAIFAGLLTPQGKILFDFIICNPEPNRYWLDCPRAAAADLSKRLMQYRLRAKIEVADKSDAIGVAVALGEETPPMRPLAAFADPRHPGLPRRFYFPLPGLPATGGGPGAEAYHAERIRLCIPEGARDYKYGEAFPHEVCYDLLGGVDFHKGCYVGQEVVSRMHHKGVAKTRIVGVRGPAPLPAEGAEISGGEYPVGTLGSSTGELGIALIRLDRADEALRHGVPLHAGEVRLKLRRPLWANYDVPFAEASA